MSPLRKPPTPTDAVLAEALGPTITDWNALRDEARRQFAPIAEEWVYSGQKHGWALRLKQKQRAVLYLKPLEHCFRASLALGPKAVALAQARRLPAAVLRMIDDAVQYPEGKAVRIEVRGPKDVRLALQLAAIRLEA